ncbi:HD-like signal output (HDOD) protein [Desulfobaculum xiamenense]|uniref:HD-like signal output (HDOD) protein n=1 Tax=Desulfobaculum xiamenense TaxID=995050 RepID=A0A846QNH5_9BACT|nr:hypothetical protein [Desulfobaculum xiamenense]NJB67823.1 HD-like signal output (HDOD) protein [Desulfobaculum xiamenense]
MAGISIVNDASREWPVAPVRKGQTLAEAMKNIQRARLSRKVYADPAMAGKLVAIEASPVYNSRGELIQSVGLEV